MATGSSPGLDGETAGWLRCRLSHGRSPSLLDWNGLVILETPRLVLRTWRADDLPAFAELNADPEVMRYLGGTALSREESDSIAEWGQERYAEEGIGLLAVERRQDGVFVGMCGLHHQWSYPDDVEVAWRFARRQWGYGHATEAATGWLDHGFLALGLPRVISITEWTTSEASQ